MHPFRAAATPLRRLHHARPFGLWVALVVGSAAGCSAKPSVLLPERPPAPLDRPIGLEEESTEAPRQGPPQPPTGAHLLGDEPLHVVAAARDGQWVAVCRRGADDDDGRAWAPALVVGATAALPVERFVAFAPTGRHVVYVQDAALMLLDAEQGVRVRLRGVPPSARALARPLPVDFDREGRRVAYLVDTDDGPRVRVRSLADRAEREIDPGPGRVVGLRLEAEGSLQVEAQLDEGEPTPSRSKAIPTACDVRSWRATGRSEVRHAHVDDGGVARAVPNAVGRWRGGMLVRAEDGALVLHERRDEVVVDASCRGDVLHRDVRGGRLLVACRGQEPAVVRLYAMTQGASDDDASSRTTWRALGTFGAAHLDTADSAWLDPASGRVLFAEASHVFDIQGAEAVVHATAEHALVRRAADHVVVEFETGDVRPIPLEVETAPSVLHAGPMVSVADREGAWVVDLERGRVHGRTSERPLALTRSGHVLVSSDDGPPPHGPLAWIDPSR
jgi:hypothetical protein